MKIAPQTVAVLAAAITTAAWAADRDSAARGRVLDPICVGDGWCWEHPALTRADFVAMSGSSASDLWMVGDWGSRTLLHWDGTGWVAAGRTQHSITGVWAAGPTDAWAVGFDGAILRWDGHAWADVQSPTRALLRSVWGRAADDVWALGDGPTALHYDGKSWKVIPTGTAQAIAVAWSSRPGEAWLGGNRVLLRWDGERVRDTPGAPAEVVAIGGNEKGEAWALTPEGEWSRWDGQRWSRVDAAPDVSHVRTAATVSGYGWAGEVDAIWRIRNSRLERLEGRRWTPTRWPTIAVAGDAVGVRAIWGSRPDDVWASGSRGALWHWDGNSWSIVVGGERRLRNVFAIGAKEIWAAGAGISRRDANGDWRDLAASPPEESLYALFGSAADDVWACGKSIWHWNGRTWTESLPKFPCGALWGVGQEIWAAGSEGMAHRVRVDWERPSEQWDLRSLNAMWSPGTGEAWAAGTRFVPGERGMEHKGEIFRFRAHEETQSRWPDPGRDHEKLPPQFERSLLTIWGSSARDVYAGGYAAGLLHWDGKAWHTVAGFPDFDHRKVAIWGRGRNDVWVATEDVGVQHWDGKAWNQVAPGVKRISQITGTAERVWVATTDGGILSRPRVIESR